MTNKKITIEADAHYAAWLKRHLEVEHPKVKGHIKIK